MKRSFRKLCRSQIRRYNKGQLLHLSDLFINKEIEFDFSLEDIKIISNNLYGKCLAYNALGSDLELKWVCEKLTESFPTLGFCVYNEL